MNIIELQDSLKELPDSALMREMQMPSGNAPQFLVLSELKRRKRMRDEYQRQQAADIPTVAEEVVTGAGVPQQGIMQAARAMAPKSSIAQNTGMDMAMPMQPTQAPQQPQMMADGGIMRLNQGSALSLEDLRELKEARRRLGVTDPNVLTSIAAENPFNPMAQYSTEKFGNVDLMQIASMLQRGADRDGLVANFGADAVREAESLLSDYSYRSIGQLPLGMGGQFGTISKRELRQRPIKSYRDPSQSTYLGGEGIGSVSADVEDFTASDRVFEPTNIAPVAAVAEPFQLPTENTDAAQQMSYQSGKEPFRRFGANYYDVVGPPEGKEMKGDRDRIMARAGQIFPTYLQKINEQINAPSSSVVASEPELSMDELMAQAQIEREGFGAGQTDDTSGITTDSPLQSDLADALQFAVDADDRNEMMARLEEIDTPPPSVLGAQTSEDLGLLQRATNALENLDAQLASPDLTESERKALGVQRSALNAAISTGQFLDDTVADSVALINRFVAGPALDFAAGTTSIFNPEAGASFFEFADQFDAGTDKIAEEGFFPETRDRTAQELIDAGFTGGDIDPSDVPTPVESSRQLIETGFTGSEDAPFLTPTVTTDGGDVTTGDTGTGAARGGADFGSIDSRIAKMIADREKKAESDKWMSLAQAGMALMASKNPTFGGALGEAGQAGLKSLRESQKGRDAFETDMLKLQTQLDIAKERTGASRYSADQAFKAQQLSTKARSEATQQRLNAATVSGLNDLIAIYDNQLAELGVISGQAPPAAVADRYNQIIRERQAVIDELERRVGANVAATGGSELSGQFNVTQ